MINLSNNADLQSLTTLRLNGRAKKMAVIANENNLEELLQIADFKMMSKFVLGEGSNTLISGDYEGLIIKCELKGREIVENTDLNVLVRLSGGEIWRDVVKWAVEENWGGIENLALIPGTVGAAPVQNIGAYGQSLVDTFEKLDFWQFDNGEVLTLTKDECQFGYRDSIFKHNLKNKGLIKNVYLRLSKVPKLATDYFSMWTKYESIEAELAKISSMPYSIEDVYCAVVNIRTRQLPDWNTVPTAGSFFKNPIVSKEKLIELQKLIPELQYYPADQLTYLQLNDAKFKSEQYVKLPAGRLLDYLGWKGKQIGNCSTYLTHALVLTHNGLATGREMLEFVGLMTNDMKEKLGISLDMEVVIL